MNVTVKPLRDLQVAGQDYLECMAGCERVYSKDPRSGNLSRTHFADGKWVHHQLMCLWKFTDAR